LCIQPENLALALCRVQPEEGKVRKFGLEKLATGADLAQEAPARVEMIGCRSENLPHQVEAIVAAQMGHFWLTGIFRRESVNFGGSHVGWIGDDEIVAATGQRRKQTALVQADAISEIMLVEV